MGKKLRVTGNLARAPLVACVEQILLRGCVDIHTHIRARQLQQNSSHGATGVNPARIKKNVPLNVSLACVERQQ